MGTIHPIQYNLCALSYSEWPLLPNSPEPKNFQQFGMESGAGGRSVMVMRRASCGRLATNSRSQVSKLFNLNATQRTVSQAHPGLSERMLQCHSTGGSGPLASADIRRQRDTLSEAVVSIRNFDHVRDKVKFLMRLRPQIGYLASSIANIPNPSEHQLPNSAGCIPDPPP